MVKKLKDERKIQNVARTTTEGVVNVFFAQIIAFGFSTLGLIFLARLLGPSLFGIIAIAFILPSIAMLFQDFAISHAITRFVAKYNYEGDFDRTKSIIYTGFVIEIFTAVIFTIISYSFVDLFISILNVNPSYVGLVRIASFYPLGHALFLVGRSSLLGLDQNVKYCYAIIMSGIFQGIIPVCLVLVGQGVFGAVLGRTIAYLLTGLFSIIFLSISMRRVLPKSAKIRLNFRDVIPEMLSFGALVYVSSILAGLLPQLQYSLMAIELDEYAVGIYDAAIRISAYMMFIIEPFRLVLFPNFSKLSYANNEKDLGRLYSKSIKYTAYMAVTLASILMVLSKPIVLILYGSEFLDAGYLLEVALWMYFLSALGYLVIGSFLRGQGDTSVYVIMHACLLFVGFTVSALFVVPYGAVGLIAGTITGNLGLTLIGIIWITRKYGFQPDWKSSAKIVFANLISLIIAQYLSFLMVGIDMVSRCTITALIFVLLLMFSTAIVKPLTEEDFNDLNTLLENLGALSRPVKFLFGILYKIHAYEKEAG